MNILSLDCDYLEKFISCISNNPDDSIGTIIKNGAEKKLFLETFSDFRFESGVERLIVWWDQQNLYLISVICAGQSSQIGVLNLDSLDWMFIFQDEIECTNLIPGRNNNEFYAAGHYYSFAKPQEFVCYKIKLVEESFNIISMQKKNIARIDSLSPTEATLNMALDSDQVLYTFGKERMIYE